MASWLDLIALIATISVFAGIVYGALLLVRSVSQGIESAKEGLKNKGSALAFRPLGLRPHNDTYDANCSARHGQGVEVKTSKRFDREDYVDATQRNFVKAVNAASFRKNGALDSSPTLSPPALSTARSSSSDGEKKSRNPFKRGVSDSGKDK
ncbi:unnamed protein product [Mycena citricolor]|uniref:Uncharacterized protein n=1 Tax=Mycena citricolor TaxID=2018698 RepID=A0AAD2GY57_9AGAR|nr:unnamed protein product [Mycena citricolor]